ncbi:MAG TPA: anti-sigma factor [Gemmatimonadales bacterium]|nr:anti-sigma factor [Gemmatimonadales bacterium]
MTEHRWTELAAPYALGSLDREERTELERHLETCASCRAEVQSFREVSGLLALSVAPAAPPPMLRQRVLRTARKVRSIPWLAAAAVVLAILGGLGYWRATNEARVLRTRLDVAQSQLDSTKYVVAALLDSSVAITDLAATGKAPSMRLYWNRARNIVVALAFDLPPAPAGRTYQLWAIEKGRAPVSVGIFNTSPTGRAIVTLQMPAGVRPDISAVTQEPAGGSPQPTQQPFLVGSL